MLMWGTGIDVNYAIYILHIHVYLWRKRGPKHYKWEWENEDAYDNDGWWKWLHAMIEKSNAFRK